MFIYWQVMENLITEGDAFKRVLHREDRWFSEQLIQNGWRHANAANFALHPNPLESFIMSTLPEMKQGVNRLQRRCSNERMDS